MTPNVTLSYGTDPTTKKPAIVACVGIPAFIEGKDKCEIQTTIEKRPSNRSTARSFGVLQGQKEINPYRIEYIKNTGESVVSKIKFYYSDIDMLKMSTKTTWRSQVQITTQGITLPYEYKPGLYDNVARNEKTEISTDNLNWEQSNALTLVGGREHE